MATANTRSLTGATHVPYRRAKADAPAAMAVATFPALGDPLEEGRGTATTLSARPFAKARVIAKLCESPRAAATILARIREKPPADDSNLTNETRQAMRVLAEHIERYLRNRSYRALVLAMRTTPMGPLITLTRNWLQAERDVLTTALDAWMAQTRTVAAQEKNRGAQETTAAGIGNARSRISESFDRLTAEVARLGVELGAAKDATPAATVAESSAGTTRVSNPGVAASEIPAFKVPKAKAWTGLWNDERGRTSAQFLAAYIAPDLKMADAIRTFMSRDASADAILGLTDVALAGGIEDMAIARHKDLGALVKDIGSEPVGVLFLERLDFTPVGDVRGELVYTLPLTPGEKITVSHKEWSKTAEEYVKEVEEEVERQIESEVSESTELTDSTQSESEVKHKASAELTLGYDSGSGGGWRFEAKGGYEYENCRKNATEHAIKRNREITEKASSRSKQQHKLTFKINREKYVEDEQVREITNTSDVPVRWDFYRLMKKWQIDLFHVGERLTYEVMVPEPGDYLLRRYVELEEIRREIDRGDPFDLAPGGLDRTNWSEMAALYGAEIREPPPERLTDLFFTDSVEYPQKKESGMRILQIEVPEGYVIIRTASLVPGRTVPCVTNRRGDDDRHLPDIELWWDDRQNENWAAIPDNARRYSWIWSYGFHEGAACFTPRILIKVEALCTDAGFKAWQLEAWNQLREAARSRWITRLEGLQSRRDRLTSELLGKDSLNLRQLEHEEITKGVLRWLLGPDFQFYPELLQILHEHLHNRLIAEAEAEGRSPPALDPLSYYDERTQRLLGTWYQDVVAEYGDIIRFIHQAIEWENVKWVLYPYFWTFPGRWDFKQSLEHPDFYHRSFLRAGCARVVIPIREGFEGAWLAFAEGELPRDHPYVTIANEMRERALTNYAYTPDPNRDALERIGEPVDRWFEYTPTGALHIESGTAPADY